MKNYYLDTKFTFGKHKGRTLKEIIEINPTYVEWCILNLDHFEITDSTYLAIKSIRPTFPRSKEMKDLFKEASATSSSNILYNHYYDTASYGQYQGSYAQDVEGLSDDFINDVLDGDPEAYWNID